MATIDTTYFLALFDEFKLVPTPKIQAWIDVASSRLSSTAWGDQLKYATALLTAHMIASTGGSGGEGGGVGGPITSETVGSLSRSYGTVGQAGSGDDELRTTRYGQLFVELRKETIVAMRITGPDIFLPSQDTVF